MDTFNPPLSNNVQVLLVEDNATDAELCIRALKKHDLANQLLWVKDGAEALEALDTLFGTGIDAGLPNKHLKVVLLDLRLPKINGLEVLRRVRADPRTREVPIVVVSSSTQDSDIAEAYKLGVNSFISKPVEFKAFSDVVAQLGRYWVLVNKAPADIRA